MPKNRALLLDRDGVINEERGYVGHIENFAFMPGIFPFLRAARDRGYRLAVLTNQAGVARGYYTRADFEALTAHMTRALAREGIALDLVLACFEHEAGVVPELRRQSFWRKPNPGMVLEAIRRLDLDPARSAFLGDRLSDLEAAAGGHIAKRLWLAAPSEQAPTPPGVTRVRDFAEALPLL